MKKKSAKQKVTTTALVDPSIIQALYVRTDLRVGEVAPAPTGPVKPGTPNTPPPVPVR